jgi:hypothetical protein
MYKTKCNRCASVFFSVHSPEMKCTKPSYRCLHLRRNTLEKNTIYSYTRTLIGQKNVPNLRLTDKTFFFLANTLNCRDKIQALSATLRNLLHQTFSVFFNGTSTVSACRFVSSRENTRNTLVKNIMVKYVNMSRLLYSHIFKYIKL